MVHHSRCMNSKPAVRISPEPLVHLLRTSRNCAYRAPPSLLPPVDRPTAAVLSGVGALPPSPYSPALVQTQPPLDIHYHAPTSRRANVSPGQLWDGGQSEDSPSDQRSRPAVHRAAESTGSADSLTPIVYACNNHHFRSSSSTAPSKLYSCCRSSAFRVTGGTYAIPFSRYVSSY